MHRLTERELEIFQDIVKTTNFKKTADSLFVSVKTIKTHVNNIYKKLGIHSMTELVKIYYIEQLIRLKNENEFLRGKINENNL